MSILSLLGVDPSEFTWHKIALCGSIEDPDMFFEDYTSSVEHSAMVDDMCLSCPVMDVCARDGREGNHEGVWGSIYWDGQGRVDQDKNAHKTPEVWKQIRKRLS